MENLVLSLKDKIRKAKSPTKKCTLKKPEDEGFFPHRCDQNMDRQWNLECWYDYCRNYKGKKEKRRQRYWKQNRNIPMELRNGM